MVAPCYLVCQEDARQVFFDLAEAVAQRVRREGLMAGTVQITLKDTKFHTIERQQPLHPPSYLAPELYEVAMNLLTGHHSWTTPLRAIGMRATDLLPLDGPQQMDLFGRDEKRERLMQMENTVEDLRKRFGHGVVQRGLLLEERGLGIQKKKSP